MLVTGIKSKPVYSPLAPDLSGRYHSMVGLGEGIAPLLNVVRGLHESTPESGARTTVLVATDAPSQPVLELFCAAGAAVVHVHPTHQQLLTDLDSMLSRLLMCTRLFVAGSESFMGPVMSTARRFPG